MKAASALGLLFPLFVIAACTTTTVPGQPTCVAEGDSCTTDRDCCKGRCAFNNTIARDEAPRSCEQK